MPIKFGTEGWRGLMAGDFTFAGVRRVTAALADYLEENGSAGKGVAISFDRRFLSREFAQAAAGMESADWERSRASRCARACGSSRLGGRLRATRSARA